ncbi:MAG: TRAP transporter small permease [Rhodobiaceae bacterium]|nr:TRAP transporter small permease [Rhodobiaceae bacterium]MCC0018742.1 TRAP transporter small permease [Rhodobiaceae bacterium]MCC0052162.1 TRAP transporter small permease [Rhodobiaceae bacterium]MCC0061313.1 TRAP transporter small permease [Rhodobiaceae bacterium]
MTAHSRNGFWGVFVRSIDRLSTLAGFVASGMIVLAVAITCQMIWVRFVLSQSTVWQTEMVIYLMVAATLIGLPYVQKLRGHVNVDLIPIMLSPGARKMLAWGVCLLVLVVAGIMTFYGFEFWHIAWKRGWKSDTVWGVRLWIPYLAMPVGFGLLGLQYLADLAALATGADKPFGLDEKAEL